MHLSTVEFVYDANSEKQVAKYEMLSGGIIDIPQNSANVTEKGGVDGAQDASSSEASRRMVEGFQKNIRCIDWDVLRENEWLFTGSIRDSSVKRDNLFDLSRPVKEGEEISYFISHSWRDSGVAKMKQLAIVAQR